MKCARCSRDIRDKKFRGDHWLCGVHRMQRCAALVRAQACVTEYKLLRGLVFDFPLSCERNEAAARANYASETWNSRERPFDGKAVLRAHRMLGRVTVTATTTTSETLELMTEFIAFVLRHAWTIAQTPRSHERLLRRCAFSVSEWYPVLIRPASMGELMRSERIVRLIRRETGSELFLVKADVVAALSNVPLDIAERIYVAYIELIAPKWRPPPRLPARIQLSRASIPPRERPAVPVDA